MGNRDDIGPRWNPRGGRPVPAPALGV